MELGVYQGDDVTVRDVEGVVARSVVNRRGNQQDAVAVLPHLVAVADGLGGHERGEAASRAALDALCAEITGPCTLTELLEGTDAAQRAVAGLADAGVWRNPGTTLVALAVADDGASVHGVWCGDSRGWLLRDGRPAASLTVDHVHFGGGLSSCLGDHGDNATPQVDTFTLDVGHGDTVLLCSDGVHGRLGAGDPRRRAELVAELSVAGIDALIDAAVDVDTDNATAVLVDIDTWAAGVAARRSPAPWTVRSARQSGQWSMWVEGLTAHALGATRDAAAQSLARALIRWADDTNDDDSFADLHAAVTACGDDVDAVRDLLR